MNSVEPFDFWSDRLISDDCSLIFFFSAKMVEGAAILLPKEMVMIGQRNERRFKERSGI